MNRMITAGLTTAVLAGTALPASAAAARPTRPAGAGPSSPRPAATGLPVFDFSDCPAPPAGVERSGWRCEVMVANGSVKIGNVDLSPVAPMTLTHAEGPAADGSGTAQVFGALRAGTTPVPGGLLGHGDPSLLRLSVRPQYAGYANFLSTGTSKGALSMKFALTGPLTGRRCAIGSDNEPVREEFTQVGSTQVISADPPVLRFQIEDRRFTVPAAHGCGPLDQVVDQRFGLPSQAGAGTLSLTAYYSIKSYS